MSSLIAVASRIRAALQARLGGELADLMARAAGGTFALKAFAVALGFTISVVLARALGPAGLGVLTLANTWIGFLAVPACLGMDNLLVRYVAIYQQEGSWQSLRGLVRWSLGVVGLLACALATLAAVLAWAFVPNRLLLHTFWLALLGFPAGVLLILGISIMRGLHRVVLAQVPQNLAGPAVLLGMVLLARGLLAGPLQPTHVAAIQVVTSWLTLALGSWLLIRSLPRQLKLAEPTFESRHWLRAATPLLFITLLWFLSGQTDLLMLGALRSAREVGLYTSAVRLSAFVSSPLLVANLALAPIIAQLHSTGQLDRLQRGLVKTARVVTAISLPVALVLMVLAAPALRLFGSEYQVARNALRVLVLGHVVNVLSGSVGQVLMMTGHGRDAATGLALGSAANVALNAALIPTWGIEGAALSSALSTTIWNVFLVWRARRRLNVWTSAFAPLAPRE